MPTIHPVLPADGDDAIVEPYNAVLNLIIGVLNGSIDADNLADGGVTLSKLSAAVQSSLIPAGVIIAYGNSTPPLGFLVCDGGSYLRGSYPTLFAVVGTSYGSADSTHFNVPDLRGRIPVGADALGGSAANRIQRTTTITTTSGSASATLGSATNVSKGMVVVSANVPAGTTIIDLSGTSVTLSANATATGSAVAARLSMLGNDANLMGAAGGADIHTLVTSQMPVHNHGTLGGQSKPQGTGGNTVISIDATNTGNAGGDQAHPNMQPSVTTNFIIKT